MDKYDERDTMFSRMELEKGSTRYQQYYRNNPEKQELDDLLREMPGLMEEGTPIYDPVNSPLVRATFRFLADIKELAEGKENSKKVKVNPAEISAKLKGLAAYYGADLVGITKIRDEHYYSHRGRGEDYGKEIKRAGKFALVFAVEMDREMINRAPRMGEAVEVTKGYVQAALIGMILSYYLRELGYQARNHMDGNYLLIAPLLAVEAGLGEIGRMGLLVTRKYGPRVRLGVVTTDLELITDQKQEFRLQEFCRMCRKCALTCPGEAISQEPQQEVDGVKRWKIDQEKCYQAWRHAGSDCGVCLSICPFSQELDQQLLEDVIKGEEPLAALLKWYDQQYPHRPFNIEPHDWL